MSINWIITSKGLNPWKFILFRSYTSTKLKASGERERERENTGMTGECKGNGSIETDGGSDGRRSMYDCMFTGEYYFSGSSGLNFHSVVKINLNAKLGFLSHQFFNYSSSMLLFFELHGYSEFENCYRS